MWELQKRIEGTSATAYRGHLEIGRSISVGILLTVLLALPLPGFCDAPLPTDPMTIRNELRPLRKRSADNDPEVRTRIDALLKQLQKLQSDRDAAESQARGGGETG